MRENAEAEKRPVTISLHLHPPPLVPLLAGQCLCSDLLKKQDQRVFDSGAREARRGGVMNLSVWALTVLQG